MIFYLILFITFRCLWTDCPCFHEGLIFVHKVFATLNQKIVYFDHVLPGLETPTQGCQSMEMGEKRETFK